MADGKSHPGKPQKGANCDTPVEYTAAPALTLQVNKGYVFLK